MAAFKPLIKALDQLFLTQASLACFNCLGRADFNFPVALFAYLIWRTYSQIQRQQLAERLFPLYGLITGFECCWFLGLYKGWTDFATPVLHSDSWLYCVLLVSSAVNLGLKLVISAALYKAKGDDNDEEVKQAPRVYSI
mmetsp:Transcript_18800/g.34091  ORF Transcript_18800/g.34091 Transcript_18800/m.34091 type:complete len:139 (-) Transcript_18800:513-929(-)